MSKKNILVYKSLVVVVTLIILCAVIGYLYPKPFVAAWFKKQYIVRDPGVKMLLVWRRGIGERELGSRIMIVMQNLGVNVRFVCAYQGDSLYDKFIADKPALAAAAMQPDFILTIDREVPVIAAAPNFLVLDQSSSNYIAIDLNNKPKLINPEHYKFAGLLPAFKEIDLLKEAYEANGREYVGFNWRPTVHRTNFKAQRPQKLFYPGGDISDNTRSTNKYIEVFRKLEDTGYFEVYGSPGRWLHTPKSYRGSIPFDGVSMLKINNQAGVTLIFHARDHLATATPTGRIFEAVGANTVVISDRNQFIIDNFGDNVLYIDVDQDAAGIFSQIDQHMQWIFNHPQQAQQMAERCHDIFMEKFTLEEQMLRLLEIAL
jgi:hypothetical protein